MTSFFLHGVKRWGGSKKGKNEILNPGAVTISAKKTFTTDQWLEMGTDAFRSMLDAHCVPHAKDARCDSMETNFNRRFNRLYCKAKDCNSAAVAACLSSRGHRRRRDTGASFGDVYGDLAGLVTFDEGDDLARAKPKTWDEIEAKYPDDVESQIQFLYAVQKTFYRDYVTECPEENEKVFKRHHKSAIARNQKKMVDIAARTEERTLRVAARKERLAAQRGL